MPAPSGPRVRSALTNSEENRDPSGAHGHWPWLLLECGRKTQLKVRRRGDRRGQIFVFLAFGRAAELLDRRQLVLREIDLALDDVGLAEVFPHLGVLGIERDRS